MKYSKLRIISILALLTSYFTVIAQSITLQPGSTADPAMVKITNTANLPRTLDLPVVSSEERQKLTNIKTGSTVFDRDKSQILTYFEKNSVEKFWVGGSESLQVPHAISIPNASNDLGFGNSGDVASYTNPSDQSSTIFFAVGAPNENAGKGAVYIYKLANFQSTNHSFVAKVTASDGIAGDNFGESLAIMDGYLVVGAPKHNSQTGALYIFKVNQVSSILFLWPQTSKITLGSAISGDFFGSSVKLFKSPNNFALPLIAATSPGDNLVSPALNNYGSVNIFRETSTNAWAQIQSITNPGGQAGEGIGMKLGLCGNGILAWTKNPSSTTGSVHVCTYNTATNTFTNIVNFNLSEKIVDFSLPKSESTTTSINSLSPGFLRMLVGLNNKFNLYAYNTSTSTWTLKNTIFPFGFTASAFAYGVNIDVNQKIRIRDYQNQYVVSYSDFTGEIIVDDRIYFNDFTSNNYPKGSMFTYGNILFLGDGSSSSTSQGKLYVVRAVF